MKIVSAAKWSHEPLLKFAALRWNVPMLQKRFGMTLLFTQPTLSMISDRRLSLCFK